MKIDIKEINSRLKEARETAGFSVVDAAAKLNMTENEYLLLEEESDIKLSVLSEAASLFGVDLVDILTGSEPKLTKYEITREGDGLPIKRREGFSYRHLASLFKNRKLEPVFVTAPFGEDISRIKESVHVGQEWNYIISGRLKIIIDGKEEILETGDSIIFDSETPHKMTAMECQCEFLAILIN